MRYEARSLRLGLGVGVDTARQQATIMATGDGQTRDGPLRDALDASHPG